MSRMGTLHLFLHPVPGVGGREGQGTSEGTCRSMVLVLALEEAPGPHPGSQGQLPWGWTLKSRRHKKETEFLVKAEQGRQVCGARFRFPARRCGSVVERQPRNQEVTV